MAGLSSSRPGTGSARLTPFSWVIVLRETIVLVLLQPVAMRAGPMVSPSSCRIAEEMARSLPWDERGEPVGAIVLLVFQNLPDHAEKPPL